MRDVIVAAPAGQPARRCDMRVDNPTALIDAFSDARAASMTVSDDGGWCGYAIRLMQDVTSPQSWRQGMIVTAPQHGRLRLRRDADGPIPSEYQLLHVEYAPTPGYIGADMFAFRLQPGMTIRTVTVQAGPAPAAAAAATEPVLYMCLDPDQV